MKKTEINEKTLELNICEEYLQVIRRDHPKAYWYGPTTQEEKELGYDARIEGAEGYALFLQFKRPLQYAGTLPKRYPYRFRVETEQHETLQDLAAENRGSVEYAFPLIGNQFELKDAIPNLRAETYFCPLDTAPRLYDPPKSHRVDVYPDHAVFYSRPVEAVGYRGRWIRREFRRRRDHLRTWRFEEFVLLYDWIIDKMAELIQERVPVSEHFPRAMFLPL